MVTFLHNSLLLILPLFLTGVLHHFIVIKKNLFRSLARPVDAGYVLGKHRLFGDKKTWRGFIVVIFSNAVLTYAVFKIFNINIDLKVDALTAGALVGFGYSLFELPNSFIKRRLGIPPSQKGTGIIGNIFNFVDHFDSILGALVAGNLISSLAFVQNLFLFAGGVILHYSVDKLLHAFSYKKSLRH